LRGCWDHNFLEREGKFKRGNYLDYLKKGLAEKVKPLLKGREADTSLKTIPLFLDYICYSIFIDEQYSAHLLVLCSRRPQFCSQIFGTQLVPFSWRTYNSLLRPQNAFSVPGQYSFYPSVPSIFKEWFISEPNIYKNRRESLFNNIYQRLWQKLRIFKWLKKNLKWHHGRKKLKFLMSEMTKKVFHCNTLGHSDTEKLPNGPKLPHA
jgi:hypothetical protein